MIILISIYSAVYTQQNQIKKIKNKNKDKNTENLPVIHAYSKHNPIQYQKL